MSSEMYAEIIMDYYRHPRNYGQLQNPALKARDSNPLCGDIIEFQANVDCGSITLTRFNGRGCAISQAAASMLAEFVEGKKVEEAAVLTKEEMLSLLGIPVSAVRLKCALLGLKVFKLAAYKHLGQKYVEEENGVSLHG